MEVQPAFITEAVQKNPISGAVVAGPDPTGAWQDDGNKYQFTEVAINYNA
ncbi:MAG TPA: glycoside hydrolase family 9 protein [Chitinispirillaceae bacterium]|nr:glycoside hydrolase family 9 protein [Chitinispirillaceae bacterium]